MCTPWYFLYLSKNVSGMRPAREQSVPGRLLYEVHSLTLFPSPSIDSHMICNRLYFGFPGAKTAPAAARDCTAYTFMIGGWIDLTCVIHTLLLVHANSTDKNRADEPDIKYVHTYDR